MNNVRRKTFSRFSRLLTRCSFVILVAACSILAASARVTPAVAGGNQFYVSPTGSDSNSGTSRTTPWLTLQKAANSVSAGDTVTVLAGSYTSQRVTITRSGTASAPITFQAEGLVKMKGFTVTANYITVRGFYITGTDDDWTDGWGIYVRGTNCVIDSNHVYYATRGGIILYANVANPGSSSNCVVTNNKLERNSQVGIEVHGRNQLIQGNEVWGSIQYHPNWADPPDWVDSDGIHFFGSGHTFRDNYIHDISYSVPENRDPHIDCFQTYSDSNNEPAQNVTFERNVCDDVEATGDANSPLFTKGFMLQDADHILIRNNVIKAFANINIHGSSNISIVNNDFFAGLNTVSVDYDTVGIAVTTGPNTTIENNIFYNLPNHIYVIYDSTSKQGLSISHNLAYRSDGVSLNSYDKPLSADDWLWGVNPMLSNPDAGNYRLLSSSPAIDAGIKLSTVTTDYYGTPRPQGSGYDLGIVEHIGTVAAWLPMIRR